MSADIRFYTGVQSEYDALGSTKIDPNGIYFLSDTTSIMKNNIKYSCGDIKIATGSAAGIIKPSGDFDITSDGTLSIYKAMSVNSFSNNSGTSSTDAQAKADKALKDAKAYTDQEKAKYLPLTGGTLSGKIKYAAGQVISDNNDIATKAYVDTVASGILPSDVLTVPSITTGTTNGTIKVKDKSVAVYGLKSAAYHDASDFATPDDLTWSSIE